MGSRSAFIPRSRLLHAPAPPKAGAREVSEQTGRRVDTRSRAPLTCAARRPATTTVEAACHARFEEPMAEETKKPKIDLKARLGKTMVQGGGSAVPLPVPGAVPGPMPGIGPSSNPPGGDGSMPPFGQERTSAPPSNRPVPAPPAAMGISPGIPLPAFAAAIRPQAAAPPPAAPQGAAAQTIKVEIGEEIHEERKRASKQKVVFSAIGLAVGIALGFVVGGMRANSVRSAQAIEKAGELEGEVKTAAGKMSELSVLLDQGAEALQAKKYPDDLSAGLASLQIPFDTNNVAGKNLGAMPAKIFRSVLIFTKEVEDLNEKKDSLRNLLGALKKPVEKAWADEKEPKFEFAVVFGGAPEKMVADLVRVKDPFKVQGDWAKDVPIMQRQMVQGKKQEVEKKAVRWLKGDLTGETPVIIPVDPSSVAGFTSDQTVIQLRKSLIEMKQKLDGDKSDPQNETMGLVKLGEQLAADLNNLSLQK
jgi:hypothetical protein